MNKIKSSLVTGGLIAFVVIAVLGWNYTEAIKAKNKIEQERIATELRINEEKDEQRTESSPSKFENLFEMPNQVFSNNSVTDTARENNKVTTNEEVENLRNKAAELDMKALNEDLEVKCRSWAYSVFQKEDFYSPNQTNYVWQSHWNKALQVCILNESGWDTELLGTYNTMLYDPVNMESYGSITLYSADVASGIRKRNDFLATDEDIKICVKKDEVKCTTLKEWNDYEYFLMNN